MDRRSTADRRLLVVDDDAAIRQLMLAIFNPLNIEVDFAADGRTALSLLRREDYDAIVLDLFVPFVNGFEIISEMKATMPRLLPHTMVLTAASPGTLRDFKDGKLVSCVMRKPFDLAGFVEAVLTCCGASDDRQTPRLVRPLTLNP